MSYEAEAEATDQVIDSSEADETFALKIKRSD